MGTTGQVPIPSVRLPASRHRLSTSQTCPQCGGASGSLLRTNDLNRGVDNRPFSYYRCVHCGLVFLSPIPADLGRYYPETYYVLPPSQRQLAIEAQSHQPKLDIVQRLVSHGRMLEIGSAYGAFAFLAKRAGFEVEAIEMDERCCRFLEDAVGVRAHQSDDPLSSLERLGRFDVIALWHVIEHLRDPWTLLDTVPDHLLPGGVLAIATPNPGSLQFRIFRHRWAHLDAPRHLHLIPMSLLESRMHKAGMTVAYVSSSDRTGLGWNIFGWRESLAHLAQTAGVRGCLRMIGRVLARVVAPMERRDFLGSTYTIAFRK